MKLEDLPDRLFHIENLISDLASSYGCKVEGIEQDVSFTVSCVQELRYEIEEELGI
jgi:hypothetical protein